METFVLLIVYRTQNWLEKENNILKNDILYFEIDMLYIEMIFF